MNDNKIRISAWVLALFFSLIVLDALPMGELGSLLRVISVLPCVCLLTQIDTLKIRLNSLTITLGVFCLFAVCSLFYTIDQTITLRYVFTLMLNTGIVFVLGGMTSFNGKEIELLKKAMLFGGWVTIIITLLFADYSSVGRLTLRFGSSVLDQNGLNGFFLFPFVWHLNCASEKHGSLFHLIPAFFIVILSLMTGSRGAILTELILILVIGIHAIRNGCSVGKLCRFLLCFLGGVLILFFFVRIIISDEVLTRFTYSYLMEKGTTGRTKIWRTLLTTYIESPTLRQIFGYGYGTTRLVNAYKHYVAHNLYLDNLVSVGMAGMLSHLALYFCCLFHLGKQRDDSLTYTFLGYMIMCFTLSLVSFRPIWNMMILTMILFNKQRQNDEI